MTHTVKILCIALIIVSCNNADTSDASGAFEADEVIIAAEVSGVIRALQVQEGKSVQEGQLMGWIDSTQLYLRKKQLEAQIQAILSRRPRVATQLASLREQLRAAEKEQQRILNLYKADAATQKQVDDMNAQVDVIRKQLEAQRSSLNISTQGLVSETLPLEVQIAQLEDQLGKCRITNPLSGTILAKYVEAHEVVTPGKPLYKVADIRELDLKAYVTGSQLPAIALGQPVTVLIDAGAENDKTYPGTITWISSKAEFTPKTIQTKEERADLVYAIKVRVKNDGYLKIGMYGELKF